MKSFLKVLPPPTDSQTVTAYCRNSLDDAGQQNIKVSVIIPVFNTEKYLEEAIGSIVNQTLREIEIIVVNDCSTDNSAQILERFAQQDSRIKILTHEKNKGQSVARNTGMGIMKGEYLYFFDSDDVLESDCLRLCYEKSKTENLDFLFFDAVTFYDFKSNVKFNYQRTSDLEPKIYSGTEILRILLKKRNHKDTVWLNFIKASYLKSLKLSFIPNINYEDVLFTLKLYAEAKRVSFISRSFFHRRIRENSYMTSKMSERKIDDLLFVSSEVEKYKATIESVETKKLINIKNKSLLVYLVKKILTFKPQIVITKMPLIIKLYLNSIKI